MKRHLTIISLVMATMLFAACQKDENGLISLNVEVSNYAGAGNTKMYVDASNYTHWTTGDQVKINGTDCPVNLSGSKAQITGVEQSASYTAIYPASIVTSANTINLPAEQAYSVDGSGNQIMSAPMAAYTENNTLTFSNLCALIRVNVTATTDLEMERIIITSSSTNLCGSGTITFSGTPTLGVLDGSKTVTLTFGGTTTVSSGDTKSFYIYVPQFSDDISVYVQARNESDYKYVWKKTKTDASLSANSIGAVQTTPTEKSANKYFFGAGTSEEDPYLIYKLDELERISDNSSDFFKLMSDIDCGEGSWTPKGTSSSPFQGKIDGNGYTITYKISYTAAGQTSLGLFGYTSKATIKNLKVSGSIEANNYAGYAMHGTGSIVGYSYASTIQNCYSTVNITSSYTSTYNLNYGGIVGYVNSGSVSYCFVSSTINGNGKNRVGGIIGNVATGSTVTHCTFEGTVSGGTYVGMVAGNINNTPDVTNCHYYVINTETYDGIKGKGGSNSTNSTDVTGTIRSSKADLQTYVSGITGYDVYTSSLSSRLAEL